MDIPLVLDEMTKRGVLPKLEHWGRMANSNAAYEEFVAQWPHKGVPVPTKAEMETIWTEIDIPPKNDNEIETELDTWLSNSTNMKQLLVKYFKQRVKEDPDFLKRIGITIS